MFRASRGRSGRLLQRHLFNTPSKLLSTIPPGVGQASSSQDVKQILSDIRIRSTNGSWREIPALINDVSVEELVKAAMKDRALTRDYLNDIVGAMLYSNPEKLSEILQMTKKDNRLASLIGVKQLLKISAALSRDPKARGPHPLGDSGAELTPAALLTFTKTLSEWLMSASNRGAFSYVKQLVVSPDIRGLSVDKNRLITTQIEQLDIAMKERASASSARTGKDGDVKLLGDVAMLFFTQLRSAGNSSAADQLLKEWVSKGLVHAGNITSEAFSEAVTRCLLAKGFDERVITVNPVGAAAQIEDADAVTVDSQSKVSRDKSKSPKQPPGSYTEGLDALFEVAGGNSAEAIRLRESFLKILLVNGKSNLAIEYAERMRKEQLLFGTRASNTLLSAYIATGNWSKALNTLDVIEGEGERVFKRGFASFKKGKSGYAGSSSLPEPAFGLNIHSFIVLMTSPFLAVQTSYKGPRGRAASYQQAKNLKALPSEEACKIVYQLLQRMKRAGVSPDARLLFQIGEVGRAARDIKVIMYALEAAQQAVGFTFTNEHKEDVPQSLPFQPNTLRPSQIIIRPETKSDEDDGDEFTRSPPPLTKKDISQLYHFAMDTARITRNVENTRILLNEMSAFNIVPTATTMKNAMQCFLETRNWEDVLTTFEDMAVLGVDRDKRHATALVEALAQLGRLGDALQGLRSMSESGNMLMLPAYSSVLSQLLFALSLDEKNSANMRVVKHSNLSKEEMVSAVAEIVVEVAKFNKERAAFEKIKVSKDEAGSDAPEGSKSHEAYLAKKRGKRHETYIPDEFFFAFKKFASRITDKPTLDAVIAAVRERAQSDEDTNREVEVLTKKLLATYEGVLKGEKVDIESEESERRQRKHRDDDNEDGDDDVVKNKSEQKTDSRYTKK